MSDLKDRLEAAKETTPFSGKKAGTRFLVPETDIDAALARIEELEGRARQAVADIEKLCTGHPHAKIAWPHRELHSIADGLRASAIQDKTDD